MAAINYPGYSSVAKYHYSQACLARASPFLSDGVSAPLPDTTVVGETTCSCASQNFSSPCPGCISFLPSGLARPARLVRGIVLSAKERDFVRAARGFGASDLYLLRRHIFPETSSVLLTQAAILIPQYVLAEMTLSFLGLGVPEPVPSWGNLLSNLQQYSVLVSYWWMYLPALSIVPFFLGYLGLASALQESPGAYKIGRRSLGSLA